MTAVGWLTHRCRGSGPHGSRVIRVHPRRFGRGSACVCTPPVPKTCGWARLTPSRADGNPIRATFAPFGLECPSPRIRGATKCAPRFAPNASGRRRVERADGSPIRATFASLVLKVTCGWTCGLAKSARVRPQFIWNCEKWDLRSVGHDKQTQSA